MDLKLVAAVEEKMHALNSMGQPVIFVVTGPNGCGKTVLTKKLLTSLPFHQSFNLGAVAKTIRYIYQDAEVSRLENFTNQKIIDLFTPIVQFACTEYEKNGVNVIVDGVQVDTSSTKWNDVISGGVILDVNNTVRMRRNEHAETHFKRKMELSLTDACTYAESNIFTFIDNNSALEVTFNKVIETLSVYLDKQIYSVSSKDSLFVPLMHSIKCK